MKPAKRINIYFIILFLVVGIFTGCEGDKQTITHEKRQEQAQKQNLEPETGEDKAGEVNRSQNPAESRSDFRQSGQTQQIQPSEKPEQTQRTETGTSFTDENLAGRQVVSSDGRLLGMVEEINEKSGIILVKSGEKLHPVPMHLIKKDVQGPELKAGFDQKTFQESPSVSKSEQKRFSDTDTEQVRG